MGSSMSAQLPEGFVIDEPAALPPGFVLDSPEQAEKPDSFLDNTRAVLAEAGAGAMREAAGLVDFVVPDTVNAVMSLAGSDKRMPTLTDSLEGIGIQGGFMEPGTAQDAVRGAGQALTMAGGFAPVTRNVAKIPGAIAEFAGIGAAKAPIRAASVSLSQQALEKLPEAEQALLSGSGDVITATKKLDPSAPLQAPRAITDKVGKEAVKQGFDEGLIAQIKASPKNARKKMAAMVDIVEKGKKNFRYSAENRPLDIAGDSVLTRVKVVREANRAAGNRLDSTAKALKGQQIDVTTAVDGFLKELDGMGVQFNPTTRELNFKGSDLEGVVGPQRVIKNVITRMLDTKAPDAFDTHRMKRFIDEQVTYGKNARGLGGKTENILKSLRHNLDSVLDENFPAYDKVNTEYAQTIGALDALQDVAGKKMDFYGENADQAIGTLTRRLLSNAQSRIPLKDAIKKLDDVAQRFVSGGTDVVPFGHITKRSGVKASDLDDDIMGQVMFVDELEKMFGTNARTSLQGDVEKGVRTGIQGPGAIAVEGAVALAKKVQGVNETNAMKALRELLKESK